jgi:hypothetical protein
MTNAQAAVALSGSLFFVFLLYLGARRPVIFVSFLFVIFSMAWRTTATMFIDLTGPVYSSQLVRTIGPGIATTVSTLAYLVILLPFLFFLRKDALEKWSDNAERSEKTPGVISLADLTFAIVLVFLVILFADLLRHGPIPLFNQIERYAYSGGLPHRFVASHGYLLTFWCGTMFTASYIQERRIDIRMPGLLLGLVVYALLTGNRFSAFYSLCSFFIMPTSAAIAVRQAHATNYRTRSQSNVAPNRARAVAAGFAIILTVTISYALYNNLTNVRGYTGGALRQQLLERVLVQPSEIGWASFERVFLSNRINSPFVFNFLFKEPIDPKRNTSIQYLMFATVGEPATSDAILHRFQFAGGFPEIFFELFGLYLAWPFLFGAGCLTAMLTGYIIRGIILGDYISAFLSFYLLYGFYVLYIGGMLNFVLPWTYWAKLAAFVSALLAENMMRRTGRSLLPWQVFTIARGKRG